jgi:AcrR family transcriptional regulator
MTLDTKQILLNVTRDLIASKGVDAVSMREVGSRAGLSRSALYRHFENKESLLAAIVVENFIVLGEKINELQETGRVSKALLIEVFLLYYNFGLENPGYYQLMFNTKWDTGKFPEIYDAAYSLFRKISSLVHAVLSKTAADPSIVIRKTAILYAFIHGLVECI